MAEHDGGGEFGEEFLVNLHGFEIQVAHAQFIGESRERIFLGDQAHIDRDLVDAPPVGQAAGQFDLLLIQ